MPKTDVRKADWYIKAKQKNKITISKADTQIKIAEALLKRLR